MYPHLCKLAYLHLLGSASSVPVECRFSTTGLVANCKKISLSADKLYRMMTFIHDNLKIHSVLRLELDFTVNRNVKDYWLICILCIH